VFVTRRLSEMNRDGFRAGSTESALTSKISL
jgi:hypothetical protein